MLNYFEFGSGNTVLLIHGLSTFSLWDWQFTIPHFLHSQNHVISLDLLGHGLSGRPDKRDFYTTAWQYRAVSDWFRNSGLSNQVDMISHSYGALLALKLVAEFPPMFRKVILISPFYRFEDLSKQHKFLFSYPELFSKLWQKLPGTFFERGIVNKRYELLKQNLTLVKTFDSKKIKQSMLPSPNILFILKDMDRDPPDLMNIDLPIMIIFGERDTAVSPNSAKSLISTLPRARGKGFEKTGHLLHRLNHRAVNRLIADFFKSP